ncbi:MAG TPA: ATPase, T2SS/T4P/T4SS family [Candidatus Acidoferrum sp.]|nr:ATPase, T2SS/T4P/T4SS family [Candidatus Acidoferrum sp.]
MTAMLPVNQLNNQPIADTGEALASLLLNHGLINDKQLIHARRVRSKLAQAKTLLNTMLELEFFTTPQLNEVLKNGKLSVRLGDLLVELGDITAQELEQAIRLQKDPNNHHKKLGEILVEHRLIREQRLIDVLANHLGFLHVEPDFNAIDKLLLERVPANQCEMHGFIPIKRAGEAVIVACTDPNNRETRMYAQSLLNCPVELAICSQFGLKAALHKFKNSGPLKLAKQTSDESLAMRVVAETLQAAVAMKASDIHMEPYSKSMRIRFRTDSMLWEYKEIPVELSVSVITRLKILSKANIAEKRRHQDGKIEYTDPSSGQIIDVRCSFYICVHGEKACLRLLSRRTELLNIDHIGMAPAVLERFKYEALEVPTGVVLITGPTGSGKTTTLYSCVDFLNNDDTSIITAEEPVEYVIEGVTQCSLNPKIDMTFAETLRHMVRQDPDVIVLGEIRDHESAEAAIQSALTGHKVLTTFHTEDTIGGLLRLMNMNIETFMISSTVVSVLAQRLLKRVCPHCAKPYRPSPLEMQRTGMRVEDLRIAGFMMGSGCEACKFTGYSGRVSVFELLVLDERVKEAILTRKASYDIRRISIECSGLITLLEDGLEKAARGLTTVAEVLRMLPRNEKPRSLAEIRRISRTGDV